MNRDSQAPVISRVRGENGAVFMLGKAGVGLQLNEDEALYTARTLSLLLGLRVEFKNLDANKNN